MKTVDLCNNRKLVNALRAEGLRLYNPQGAWNGYGYERIRLHVELADKRQERRYNKIVKTLESAPIKKSKTAEEKKEAWAKRLCKHTGITLEEAKAIATEKLNYQTDRINDMIDRQNSSDFPSKRRQSLINKMMKENPLRRIEDIEHAQAILSAHRRHTQTNYDMLLAEAHEEESIGMRDKGTAKEYARSNMQA